MTKISKIDELWDKIFEDYNILQNIKECGKFEITSKVINDYREARLMTKFDHSSDLPKIFIDNKLCILPTSRGSYVIGEFQCYFDLSRLRPPKIRIAQFPEHITSIDKDNIYSEASAILCAFNSQMLNEITGENCHFTVMGRMSTGEFEFHIDNSVSKVSNPFLLNIKNAQCEIDGGFESEKAFIIIEAKNRAADDFLIRQLYFPFRLWESKLNKEIIPVLLCTCDGVYSFFKFKFKELNNYNSLEIVDYQRYRLGLTNINLEDLVAIAKKINVAEEPKIPFPQANSIGRIVELIDKCIENNGIISIDQIAEDQNFHLRQADYYGNAGAYIGVFERVENKDFPCFGLTDIAFKFNNRSQRENYLKLVELILSHAVFLDVFNLYIDKSTRPTVQEVVDIMNNYELYKLPKGSSTRRRRASSVLRWIDWIFDLQDPVD